MRELYGDSVARKYSPEGEAPWKQTVWPEDTALREKLYGDRDCRGSVGTDSVVKGNSPEGEALWRQRV